MENTPKSQVVERLREAQNVLVTVSNNPSVDQLASAIGLTLLLNKLGKHATAVFSGKIPSTLEFLKPEDTLETNTNSLRDFIIALDKSKADKLRYKVEENLVRIFITPYRTSLSEADLDFSQGDFNVDVVMALGVDEKEHIDQAIVAHGRILHDATVIGVMAKGVPTEVGNINWQDENASSLSEMLVSISEAFESNILDEQMATAFLTGIVAETDRFSNDKTTPKVMTMSAQLMAAGANQQLIANELQVDEAPQVPNDLPEPQDQQGDTVDEDGVLTLSHESDAPAEANSESEPEAPVEVNEHGIHIDEHGAFKSHHELAQAVEEVQAKSKEEVSTKGKTIEPLDDTKDESQQDLSKYVSEPPQNGGTFTASTVDEILTPPVDPLSQIPEQPAGEDLGLLPSHQSPLISVQDDAESVSATEIESNTDPLLKDDGETSTTNTPLGPEVNGGDTLDKIEDAVEAYTGQPAHSTEGVHEDAATETEPVPDEEAARQAVLDAVGSTDFDPERPEPIEALNALPIDLNNETPEAESQDDQNAPPTVPPPLAPPFLGIDEDGNVLQGDDPNQAPPANP
jgi:hypothetical protein